MAPAPPELILDRFGPLWLAGCGAMGGALLGRWLARGLSADHITVIDPSPKGLPAGDPEPKLVASLEEASGSPSILILAIKPQTLPKVAPALAARAAPDTLIISIMAGVGHDILRGLFPGRPIVRTMPNTPARIGQGVTALYGVSLPPEARAQAEALMAAAGTVHWLSDEAQFDAVTAVSGSGPAYVFRFIEALTAAGEAAGLPPALAAALARDTVAGAAALTTVSAEAPAVLRAQVTSPNGTTQAGLEALDGGGFLPLIQATVAAAAARSRELASQVAEALAGRNG